MALRWFFCARRATSTGVTADQHPLPSACDDADDPDVYDTGPSDICAPTPSSKTVSPVETSVGLVKKAVQCEEEESKKWSCGSKIAEEDGEVAMLKGNTYMLREQYQEAEQAYEHAVSLQPSLLEAHIGRVNALRKQKKFMRAFSCCREGNKVTGSEELLKMQKIVQQEYQNQKKKDEERQKKREAQARKDVDKMMKEQEKNCPSAGALGSDAKATVYNASFEEREAWKAEMLDVYRKLYAKHTSSGDGLNQTVSAYDDNLKFGLQIKDGHRPMPRPRDVQLPADFRKSVGTITLDILKQFNSSSQRLLLSVYGDIFDVSDRPDKYGTDGPYDYFSGADITWGLASGKDIPQEMNKFYDIWKLSAEERDKKLQCLCSWVGFFEKEYGNPVGRLEVYYNEHNLPVSPATEDCAIM